MTTYIRKYKEYVNKIWKPLAKPLEFRVSSTPENMCEVLTQGSTTELYEIAYDLPTAPRSQCYHIKAPWDRYIRVNWKAFYLTGNS